MLSQAAGIGGGKCGSNCGIGSAIILVVSDIKDIHLEDGRGSNAGIAAEVQYLYFSICQKGTENREKTKVIQRDSSDKLTGTQVQDKLQEYLQATWIAMDHRQV